MEEGSQKQESIQSKKAFPGWREIWTLANGEDGLEQTKYSKTQLYLLADYAEEFTHKEQASSQRNQRKCPVYYVEMHQRLLNTYSMSVNSQKYASLQHYSG